MQQRLEALSGTTYTVGELVINLVLDVLLLAAGIGLLSMRPWARTLSLVYAPLAILNRLFATGYILAVLVPGFGAIISEEGGNDPQLKAFGEMMKMILVVSAAVSALFIIYPIVVLIVLNLKHVKAAFLGQSEAPPPSLPEDEGWGPMKRPGASTDVTTGTDPDRDRFRPPT
jgi:hypothetical protein